MTVPIPVAVASPSTQAYLDSCDASGVAFDEARAVIRTALPAIAAVVKSALDMSGALVTMQMDETNVNVLAIQYEAADKAKSLQRISGEISQSINQFLRLLQQQEDVASRIRAAAATSPPA